MESTSQNKISDTVSAQNNEQPVVRPTTTTTEQPTINYEDEVNRIKNMAFTYLATQAHPVIIPSFAKWFDLSSVHEIEKTYFPEFFLEDKTNLYKTPTIYKDCRDFMINTFRLQPTEYLTITGVRRNLALDIGSIVKIHQFLEKWGLINYQIQPRTKPSLSGPQFTGHFQVIVDTPTGLKPYFQPTTKLQGQPQEVSAITSENQESNIDFQTKPAPVYMNTAFKEDIYCKSQDFMNLDTGNTSSLKKYICQSCGNDTATVFYHNLRDKNEKICIKCFKEARFKTIYSSSDFIRLDNNDFGKVEEWTDSDLFRLLESLEMFGTDWEKISSHVGKPEEECIIKFIELPIEDEFINKVLQRTTNETSRFGKDSIESTITQLLGNLKDEDKQAIIDNSNKLSEKYLKESQTLVQDLCVSKLKQIDCKLEKLTTLEKTLTNLQKQFEKDSLVLENNKQELMNDVSILNEKLQKLGINETLELQSVKRANESQKLQKEISSFNKDSDKLENGKENESNAKDHDKLKLDIKSISMETPEIYTHWTL